MKTFCLLNLIILLSIPAFAAASGQGIDDKFFNEGGILDGTENPASNKDAVSAKEAVRTVPPIIANGSEDAPDLAKTGLRVLGSLIFVALLIIGIYKLGRKAKLPFFGGDGIVKRVAVEPIGPNQFINIVEVGDKMLVLGVSEKGISMLTELNGESRERVRMMKAENGPKVKRSEKSFSSIISSLTGIMHGDERLGRKSKKEADNICAESLMRERQRISKAVL